jgi:peroxiredoxin
MTRARQRLVGGAAAVAAVAAAGLWAGRAMRDWRSGPPPVPGHAESRLTVGTPFPEVTLVDETGAAVPTGALVEGGAVVLFLDPECPACTEASLGWQGRMQPGVRLIGIGAADATRLRAYKAEHGLEFPVYADAGGVFTTEFGVTSFPFWVLVDRTGSVVAVGQDGGETVDLDRMLGESRL